MGRPLPNRAGAPRTDVPVGTRSEAELRERVKELSCLYEVTLAFVEHRADLRGCFQRIVTILPKAWRFADSASASIQLDDIEEQTPGFASSPHRISADVLVGGQRRGAVWVAYDGAAPLGGRPDIFLTEERALLDAVARQVAVFVASVEAEERRACVEAQLRHADRLATIGQLAAGVAHELNEPLGNVLGFAQLALKSRDLPDGVRVDLDKIVRATLHGREVIRKLLVFARQAPTARHPMSVNGIVEEVVFLMEAGCEQPGIRFVQSLAPDLPEIGADPVQVRQVVVNLVVNAIQSISGGGVITVSTERDGSAGIILSVRDTGCGMTPDVARHAFDPFFTTKDVGSGTGLGLAVVQGIVAAHGGAIDLETAPGQGSTFSVRLPLVGRPADGELS